jgi:hypothetical protein
MKSSTCPWNRSNKARRPSHTVAARGNDIVTVVGQDAQSIQRYANNLFVLRDRNEHGIVSFLEALGSVRSSTLAAEETSRKRGCKCRHPRPIHLVNTISTPRPTMRPPRIITAKRRMNIVMGATISPKSIQPQLTTIAPWRMSIPAKRTSSRKNSDGVHGSDPAALCRPARPLRQIEQQNLGLGLGLDDERGLVLDRRSVTLPHLGAVEGDDAARRLQP